jgi:hypothetical protein
MLSERIRISLACIRRDLRESSRICGPAYLRESVEF